MITFKTHIKVGAGVELALDEEVVELEDTDVTELIEVEALDVVVVVVLLGSVMKWFRENQYQAILQIKHQVSKKILIDTYAKFEERIKADFRLPL